jgi:hypothetical protein
VATVAVATCTRDILPACWLFLCYLYSKPEKFLPSPEGPVGYILLIILRTGKVNATPTPETARLVINLSGQYILYTAVKTGLSYCLLYLPFLKIFPEASAGRRRLQLGVFKGLYENASLSYLPTGLLPNGAVTTTNEKQNEMLLKLMENVTAIVSL